MSKKQFIFLFGFLFISSTLLYSIGRFLFPKIITDDIGDYFLWISGLSFASLSFIYFSKYKILAKPLKLSWTFNVFSGLIILGFGSFGIWGLYTEQGHKQFDEMDGVYPFFALVCACIIALGLLFINVFWFYRKRNRS